MTNKLKKEIEFNLSEKQERLRQRLIEKYMSKYGLGIINDIFFQFRDLDKEFIKRLKEEGFKKWKEEKIDFPIGNYFDFIDKLAGELKGEQKQLKVLKKGRTELAKKRLKDKREAYLRAKRALNRLRNRN